MTNLREKVWAAMDKAVEKGHEEFLIKSSAYAIALDLYEEDADLEDVDVRLMVPYVLEWKKTRL